MTRLVKDDDGTGTQNTAGAGAPLVQGHKIPPVPGAFRPSSLQHPFITTGCHQRRRLMVTNLVILKSPSLAEANHTVF